VICPDGGGMAVYAPTEAEMKKLLAKNLEESKARGCKPYVIDDALVWTGN
jgi:hypothetical protein